ncbi:MAG: hypothetical protein IPK72_21965 [Candidatus Eisenbacteria bacterium]|nr:hypothetical protein [Candidatus Eisenbacteria bacterium]
MNNLPVLPFVFLALLLLPVRVAPRRLRWLAFGLWALGGALLTWRGVGRLAAAQSTVSPAVLIAVSIGALLIGFLKGRFVLSRTSARNLARLAAAPGPLRPIEVYPARSWALITLFMLLGLSLSWLHAPLLVRGGMSLAVGVALLGSSLDYLRGFPR